ncbi:MAG: glycosyltransferase [Hyphomicrobiaceae bacterium]|nr:glycosyltransferase [Hyphomicrobiaceae bacterium]
MRKGGSYRTGVEGCRGITVTMSIAIVLGSLAPYTARIYDAYAERFGEDVHTFSCAALEPHRHWRIAPPRYMTHTVLPGLRWHVSDHSHIYLNPALLPALMRSRPQLIVAAAFSPTMIAAAAYARLARIPYGIATDGTLLSDPGETSFLHGAMRRAIVPGADFAICGSQASVRFLERWGLAVGRGVEVPIVSAWDAPVTIPSFAERPYDVIFAGGVNERYKGALFFAAVLARLAERGRKLRVRVTGAGPQLAELRARLEAAGITARIDGALQPEEIPGAMSSARLLMFPSRNDPWGLVANEAVLCGTPVLGSPHATSSPLLVERFGVGLVRPLEVEAWCAATLDMIGSEDRWKTFMARRDEAVAWFSLDTAVTALHRAFEIGRASRTTRRSDIARPREQV